MRYLTTPPQTGNYRLRRNLENFQAIQQANLVQQLRADLIRERDKVLLNPDFNARLHKECDGFVWFGGESPLVKARREYQEAQRQAVMDLAYPYLDIVGGSESEVKAAALAVLDDVDAMVLERWGTAARVKLCTIADKSLVQKLAQVSPMGDKRASTKVDKPALPTSIASAIRGARR